MPRASRRPLKLATTPAPHPSLIAPKQKRGRETAECVLDATMRLLRRAEFRSLTMTDIAREAGISVGAIYTRFPSKERLLCFLADQILLAEPDGAATRVIKALEPARDLRAFLHAYLSGIADIFTQHRAIVAPMSALARDSDDRELKAYLTRLNEAAHERLKEGVHRHAREIRHPSPDMAIDFAILWMGAAMRERILFAEPVSKLRPSTTAEFVTELADAVVTYLTSTKRPRR